jgi:hypothetical protein
MKKRTILLATAAFAAANLSIISLIPQAFADDPSQPQQQQTGAASSSDQNSGGASAGLSGSRSGAMSDVAQADRDQINRTLAQCVKAAVQPNKFNDLVNCLAKADRDRIQAQKPDTNQLDQSTKALGDAWKSKFGQDFDITDEKQPFAAFMIMNGESAEARTAGATMGPGASAGSTYGGTSSSGTGTSGASAGTSSGTSNSGAGASAGISGTGAGASAGISSNGTSGTSGAAGTSGGAYSGTSGQGQAQQASAQEGQKAHVMVPASHGLPEVTVNLVKEGGDWKIDIPDSIDANQLSQNLQTQLQQAQSMQSRWPADQNRAQAALAHHVLLALEGRSSSASGAGSDNSTGGGTGTGAGSSGTSGTGTSGSSGTSGTDSTGTGAGTNSK